MELVVWANHLESRITLNWIFPLTGDTYYSNKVEKKRTTIHDDCERAIMGSLMDQCHKLCRIFTRVIQVEAIAAGHINGIPRQCWMYIEKQGAIPCRNKLDILTII